VGGGVEFEWDEAKRRANFAKHGVDFALVELFDWDNATFWEDARRDYGENRWRAVGVIGGKLYALIYTKRRERIRVISLRIASRREHATYEEATKISNR
jgi:uncharacterized protein